MMNDHRAKYVAALGLAMFLAMPAAARAQDEDCVEGGNQNTRGAEVEFTYANSRSDTRTEQERYERALGILEENWTMEEVPPRSYLLAATAYLGLRDYPGADSMLTTPLRTSAATSSRGRSRGSP